MELRNLSLFFSAAKLGSISKAAIAARVSQPTVTYSIRNLEKEIGAQLFFRGKRPFHLTPAGQSLLSSIEPHVQSIEQFFVATDWMEDATKLLTIVAGPQVVAHFLPPVIRSYLSEFPESKLRVIQKVRLELDNTVLSGQADIGIDMNPPRSLGLKFQRIARVDRVIITPLGHPLKREKNITFAKLAKCPIIVHGDDGNPTNKALLDGFSRQGLQYNTVVELDNFDAIKRYVEVGAGIAVVPEMAIVDDDHIRIGVLPTQLLGKPLEIGLVTVNDKPQSARAQRFMAIVYENASAFTRNG